MAKFKTTIEVDNVEDVPVTVTYSAHGPIRGARDGRHGLQIEPDEPGGIEIEDVTLDQDGRSVELTFAAESLVEGEIAEYLAEREACHE